MPYILVHPLPPPKRNLYKPELPTFTTSSRSIARFFHSHGWRTRHVYADLSASNSASAPPSLTSSRSSSRSDSYSSAQSVSSNSYIDASALSQRRSPHGDEPCCDTSTNCATSSPSSCGPILELHTYLIPVLTSMFHGPTATQRQINYLRYYAHPHISFEDSIGDVDLHLPNLEAVAVQKEADESFWRQERKARRIRLRKEREARREAEHEAEAETWVASEEYVIHARDIKNKGWFVRTQRGVVTAEERMRLKSVSKLTNMLSGGRREKTVMVAEEEEDDDEECPQLVSADQDEEIDEELGEQWEVYERALLASEGLEWAGGGKTLRKRRDAA